MNRETFPHSAARGVALFLGGFSLSNILGGMLVDSFDATLWWIGLRGWGPVGTVVLVVCTLALLAIGAGLRLRQSTKAIVLAALLITLAACLYDAATFFALWRRGVIRPAMPIPLSIVIAFSLAGLVVGLRERSEGARPRRVVVAATVIACALLFPLAQMVCFGKTDYRRRADAAVVFGARAYADGRPSDALADRVRTACALYHEGFVATLVFSGGPGDGAVHETESMRRMAVAAGVPDAAIVLDDAGVNTEATVRNTADLLRRAGAARVLAVSHGYHLPRVKLAYQREGMTVYTVPARETYTLQKMPVLMAREVVAVWAYYFRPLLG